MTRFPLSASGGLQGGLHLAGLLGLQLLGLILAGAVPAAAADLGEPGTFEEAPRPALVEIGTGWYLRGDVGYAVYADPKANGIGLTAIPFDAERLNGAFIGGAGIGYKFTNWFRSDLTLDYRANADFRATTSTSNYIENFSLESAKLSATTLLINGYADLGTWYGVTPYVGVGVGVAQTRLESYRGANFLQPASPFYPVGSTGPLLVSTTLPDSSSQYNFAWALMAGASVDVDQYLKIDAGYRYVRLDQGETKLDVFGVGARVKDLQSHEFRVGLRYTIDGE